MDGTHEAYEPTEDNKQSKQQEDDRRQQPEGMLLPPQVKFGIAVMELEDGSVVRMPINPNELQITYGQMLRMLMGELEDIRAEILAMKVRKLIQPPENPQLGGGLVDRS